MGKWEWVERVGREAKREEANEGIWDLGCWGREGDGKDGCFCLGFVELGLDLGLGVDLGLVLRRGERGMQNVTKQKSSRHFFIQTAYWNYIFQQCDFSSSCRHFSPYLTIKPMTTNFAQTIPRIHPTNLSIRKPLKSGQTLTSHLPPISTATPCPTLQFIGLCLGGPFDPKNGTQIPSTVFPLVSGDAGIQPGWHNWLARETFNLKAVSSSLTSGDEIFFSWGGEGG